MIRLSPPRRRGGWPPALFALLLACVPQQRFASLGDFALESGEVIRDCRIGYRTFGRLDEARANAILVTPWAMGTSRELAHPEVLVLDGRCGHRATSCESEAIRSAVARFLAGEPRGESR